VTKTMSRSFSDAYREALHGLQSKTQIRQAIINSTFTKELMNRIRLHMLLQASKQKSENIHILRISNTFTSRNYDGVTIIDNGLVSHDMSHDEIQEVLDAVCRKLRRIIGSDLRISRYQIEADGGFVSAFSATSISLHFNVENFHERR